MWKRRVFAVVGILGFVIGNVLIDHKSVLAARSNPGRLTFVSG